MEAPREYRPSHERNRATHRIEDLLDRLRLVRTPGIGPVTYRQLIRRFGNATAALAAVPDLARRGGGKVPALRTRGDAEREIDRIRDAIDRVDEVIVRLLNQRAKYAIEIGEIKGILGLPIYAPEREKQVLQHVETASEGPLETAAVRRLFERIIDESRRMERQSAQNRTE